MEKIVLNNNRRIAGSKGKEYCVEKAPLDHEGFIQSFSVMDTENYLSFFKRYGFVVIKNILDHEQLDRSIDDIWTFVESYRKHNPISRDNPNTWKYWPGLADMGLLAQALSPTAWENRVNTLLYEVFCKIIGREDLWVSVDNWGMLRPTKNIPMGQLSPQKIRVSVEVPEEEKKEKKDNEEEKISIEDQPSWISNSRWLHWDLNPFYWCSTGEGIDYTFDGNFISENNGSRNTGEIKLQGLINLIDAREQDGGFLTIPGFCHHLRDWIKQPHLEKYKKANSSLYDFVYVPDDDPMQDQIQKIPMRAGDLLIWSSEQPHCNYGNNSDRFRMVQYIKMFGQQQDKPGADLRKRLMLGAVPGTVKASDTSCRILGISDYEKK